MREGGKEGGREGGREGEREREREREREGGREGGGREGGRERERESSKQTSVHCGFMIIIQTPVVKVLHLKVFLNDIAPLNFVLIPVKIARPTQQDTHPLVTIEIVFVSCQSSLCIGPSFLGEFQHFFPTTTVVLPDLQGPKEHCMDELIKCAMPRLRSR